MRPVDEGDVTYREELRLVDGALPTGRAVTSGSRPTGSRPQELPLWHVTVVLAGEPVAPDVLRAGLERLQAEQPFLASARYGSDRVEVRYWDEAENVDDAAAMALRIWPEHRGSAHLPDWHVVGLEVLDRETLRERSDRGLVPSALVLGEVRPL